MMIDTGDTSFMIICTAIVFFMTPALALFYAGLLRKKNSIDIIAQCLITFSIITVIWVTFGFSFAYGTSYSGLIGGFDYLFMKGVGIEPSQAYATTIPFILFFGLQLMIASITPALIAGATAERMKLKGFIIFCVLWSILVYIPICHWVWGGGVLSQMGLADFAGGTVVHMSAGVSSIVIAKVIGKRSNQDNTVSNFGFITIAAGILWFGWFAFNGGSALGANKTAALAVTNSHIAASVGVIVWMSLTYFYEKRPSLLAMIMGALAGLVSITPGAGFVKPMHSMLIAVIGSFICFYAIRFRPKLGIDDTLDVFALHGVGGFIGIVLTGIFANPELCDYTGAIYGNSSQVLIQLSSSVVIVVYTGIITLIISMFINTVIKMRVTKNQEKVGLDSAIYKESIDNTTI